MSSTVKLKLLAFVKKWLCLLHHNHCSRNTKDNIVCNFPDTKKCYESSTNATPKDSNRFHGSDHVNDFWQFTTCLMALYLTWWMIQHWFCAFTLLNTATPYYTHFYRCLCYVCNFSRSCNSWEILPPSPLPFSKIGRVCNYSLGCNSQARQSPILQN